MSVNGTKVYAVCNQKGGCGKTTATLNLGAALAKIGKKVLCVDLDAQANLTMALGYQQPDDLPVTLPDIMFELIDSQTKRKEAKGQPGVGSLSLSNVLENGTLPPLVAGRDYILKAHGLDFIPSNIELAGLESVLTNTISREKILKKILCQIKEGYDFVLIDCMPSLNFITINALAAADGVIIPLQPQFFSAKGLEMLIRTIAGVREDINPNLAIVGALITMFDGRLSFHRSVLETVKGAFGEIFDVFETKIPVSVRTTESQAVGKSIFEYAPNGKIAKGYMKFAEELIARETFSVEGASDNV